MDPDDFLSMWAFDNFAEQIYHGRVRGARMNVFKHKLDRGFGRPTSLYDAVVRTVDSVTSNAHGMHVQYTNDTVVISGVCLLRTHTTERFWMTWQAMRETIRFKVSIWSVESS